MRERYLEVFDMVRIDCLNGDIRSGGKTPDGNTDGNVFTTDNTGGIKLGTAVATLVRKSEHAPAREIAFRHLWGEAKFKREKLLESSEAKPETMYENVEPIILLGLPFTPVKTKVSEGWFNCPALPDLFPTSFPGVKTSRDSFLVDTELERLKTRITDYFDPSLSHEEIARSYPRVMQNTKRFNAQSVRNVLLARGGPNESGFIRHVYRPFDNRWLYWEAETKLLDEKRADYRPHVFEGNIWLATPAKQRKEWSPPPVAFSIGDINHMDSSTTYVPLWLFDEGLNSVNSERRPNLSESAQGYLKRIGASVEDLFHHTLATLHDPAYREANVGALRMEWPRIPLPGWPNGGAKDAAEVLAQSAARGRQLARLLDTDASVPCVTQAPLRPEMAVLAVPKTVREGQMMSDDFAVTAGWGHFGAGDAVMPGKGRAVERAYTIEERTALDDARFVLGDTAFDVYLNGRAFWRCVPAAVWSYKLGGYQVLKKWLSYREQDILGRPLKPEEVHHFTETARRIAGILMLTG